MKFMRIARYILAAVGVAALVGLAWLLYTRLAPVPAVLEWQGTTFEQKVVPTARGDLKNESSTEEMEWAKERRIVEAYEGELFITQLGVQISLRPPLDDLVYSEFFNDSNSIGLSSKRLMQFAKEDKSGDCVPWQGSLGILSLSKTGAKEFDSTIAVKLGEDEYVMWQSPQDRCTGSSRGYALWSEQMDAIRNQIRRAIPLVQPLRLDMVKVGEMYGAWMVASTTMSLREEVNVEDGSKYQALGGEVYFKGEINVRGRYEPNDLEGGVIFYPDDKFYRFFPIVVQNPSSKNLALHDGELRVGLFGGFAGLDAASSATGIATIQLSDLIFQKVSCSNCDPWQGFFVEQAVSLIKN